MEDRSRLKSDDPVLRPHRRFKLKLVQWLRQNGAFLGMLAVFAVIAILRPTFLSPNNLLNVLTQSTVLIVMALGLTITMAMRGVDLSVAQVADASGVLAAALILAGQPIWLVFAIPLAFGVLVGSINALMMAYLGVPAIIGTLGMMFIIRGGELIFSNGAQPQILFTLPAAITQPFFYLGQGEVKGIPVSILLTTVLAAILSIMFFRSSLGRKMEAVGGNARAAFLSGIDIRSTFGWGFVISSAFAAIAGVILVSRAGIAAPRGAEVYLLDSFVAVFLGTIISPHRNFSLLGTIGGAITVSYLGNGLTLLGLGAPVRYLVYGIAIIAAIAINRIRQDA